MGGDVSRRELTSRYVTLRAELFCCALWGGRKAALFFEVALYTNIKVEGNRTYDTLSLASMKLSCELLSCVGMWAYNIICWAHLCMGMGTYLVCVYHVELAFFLL